MISIDQLRKQFMDHGNIMKTSELKTIGVSSRQIAKLLETNVLKKIKTGFYEMADGAVRDEIVIAKLFPSAVIYLESALLYYGYTDRIPTRWQIAVDKNISKPQFQLSYPPITPFFIEKKYLIFGIAEYEVNGIKIRIFDKDRTICDILRYSNKIDNEVFRQAIQKYCKDKNRNIKNLMDYAKKLRVSKKVKTYIGAWI
jgi:predicted transcriptional regulator of viral defense system